MKNSKHLKTKLLILQQYFKTQGIDSEYISPNLVAYVAFDLMQFELTSDDIVYLSNNL